MAKFISLVENAGEFKDENGQLINFHSFLFTYLDEVSDADKGRNEVSSTKQRCFDVKIKADNVSRFFGTDVYSADQFDDCFGKEITLVYGRNGLAGIKFVDEGGKK